MWEGRGCEGGGGHGDCLEEVGARRGGVIEKRRGERSGQGFRERKREKTIQ